MLRFLYSIAEVFFQPRSPQWPALRRSHLRKEPTCQACGTRKHLNVHHVVPVHVEPGRELDPENLITLCESPSHNCHLIWGHFLSWKSYNPGVRGQANTYREGLSARP